MINGFIKITLSDRGKFSPKEKKDAFSESPACQKDDGGGDGKSEHCGLLYFCILLSCQTKKVLRERFTLISSTLVTTHC